MQIGTKQEIYNQIAPNGSQNPDTNGIDDCFLLTQAEPQASQNILLYN